MEENIIEQMSSSIPQEYDNKQPIDNIVYGTFVNKFNEEYGSRLSESQKTLLSKYISSFSDNGVELKFYLNEEIGCLKEKLEQSKLDPEISADNSLKEKIDQVYSILDRYSKEEVDTEMLEVVLKTQDLVEEISTK